jgi:hypothetical protein
MEEIIVTEMERLGVHTAVSYIRTGRTEMYYYPGDENLSSASISSSHSRASSMGAGDSVYGYKSVGP